MKNLLLIVSIFLLTISCVSNKYPDVNPNGTQRQPWGDTDMAWPYHFTCTKEGKRITQWNKQMREFYLTNTISIK